METPLFDQWRSRSPHYDESHEAVCDSVRAFVSREITPYVDEWEAAGELPRDLHRKAAAAGVLGLNYPEEFGGTGTAFNLFHGLVQTEELSRPGAGGISASLMTHGIGLPPVLAAGSEELKRRIAPAVLAGEKIIALGITEPGGGSDVADLRTKAERKGAAYVVNGAKTLITSGMRADYITLAVRTGGPGIGGVSLLLVETERPGVSRTKLDKMGWHCSDTATIHFDDVEVPLENLIGPENAGFGAIMRNFNSERLGMAQGAAAYARICYEDALDWARQRHTFWQAPCDQSGDPSQIGRYAAPHQRHPSLDRPVRLAGLERQGLPRRLRAAESAGDPNDGILRARGLPDSGRCQLCPRQPDRADLPRSPGDGDRRRERGNHV